MKSTPKKYRGTFYAIANKHRDCIGPFRSTYKAAEGDLVHQYAQSRYYTVIKITAKEVDKP